MNWLLLGLMMAAEPRVEVGEARLVVAGPVTEQRWGRWQFPVIEEGPGGKLLLFVHVEQDAAAAYGKARKVFVSVDHGKTWKEDAGAAAGAYGLKLRNGEWLRTDTVAATPVAGVKLPEMVAERVSYKTPFQLYRMKELPAELQRIFFQRFVGGVWKAESQPLTDAHALRYSTGGVIPQIWWGDMKVMRDGRLVALTYPYYYDSQKVPHTASAAYESKDFGRSWSKLSHILYEEADDRRDGFTEPALELLADGSLFGVLRITDGNGVGPMYRVWSRDGGRSWTKPEAFTETGVLPRLLQLKNGVLVMSSGRPGVDLRFSRDGGKTWTAARELVPVPDREKVQVDSCGYTSLVALGRDRFLIAYSWFRPPTGQKSIYVREVRVRAPGGR